MRSVFILYITLFLLSSCKKARDKEEFEVVQIEDSHNMEKPNIVFILADDLGYGDLSSYGQEKFNTPNIDKLAKGGMMFTQHYSGSTVCAPSRSVLMTGLHTGHTFIRGNKEVMPEGQYPLPNNIFTLAEGLQEAGYKTGAFGKWGLGFPGSEGDPVNQGFDVFYGFNCQRLGHNYYPDHLWLNKDSIVLKGNQGFNKGVYAPEVIHEKTLDFIDKHKDSLFFLYVPSIIPHAELAAPQEEMELFENAFPKGKPYNGAEGELYGTGSYGSQKNPRQAFAAMVTVLDNQVGDIVEKLEEHGLTENTIIIFTSDNGPHTEGGADPESFNSNGPFRGEKRDLYEGGIRVPLIVKWPQEINPGSTSDHLSAFWDFLPTFAEVGGFKVPIEIDGISMLPTLKGNSAEQGKHEYLYWEFHELGGRQAIRKGKWKAVKYDVLKNPEAPFELYNLEEDNEELDDVAAKHPEIVKEMEMILNNARTPSEVFTFDQDTYLNVK